MSDVQQQWDARFGVEGFAYGQEPNELLAESVGLLPAGGHVVSLGEGEGRNAVFLASRGFRVTAMDASEVGLAKARAFASERGVAIETVHGDLATVALPQGADAFVSIFCHMPSAVRHEVHRRAWASLGKGGVVLVVAYRPEQIAFGTGGPKDRDMLPSLADLRADFEGGEELVGAELERDVVEGRLHTGRAAVVHAVFRK